jgi:hypothetical protein
MFKYIRQAYLPHRSVHELNGYYHNVWKTRSSAAADDCLSLREAGVEPQDMAAFRCAGCGCSAAAAARCGVQHP